MKILLVATSSYAGMGPYVCEVINNLRFTNTSVFLIDGKDAYYEKNVSEDGLENRIIIRYDNTTINKLRLLLSPPCTITKEFKRICTKENFDIIHFLSGEALYGKWLRWVQKRYHTLFTIHDASAHDAQKSIHKLIRQRIVYTKLFNLIRDMDNLITNSYYQYSELIKCYPSKNVFYHSFPSLVTETVANGKLEIPELAGMEGYILFFGRIEKYKGIDVLYKAFVGTENLCRKHKLVIAGSGDIYFQRDISKEKNVIFVNRYIKDEEITSLYKHASCVVYPYLSATQSGVLSLSCYYQIPTVVSDLHYFMEQLKHYKIAYTFRNGDEHNLQEVLLSTLAKGKVQIMEEQKKYYQSEFIKGQIRNQLLTVYDNIMQSI